MSGEIAKPPELTADQRMDLLDLRPEMRFIGDHRKLYQARTTPFLAPLAGREVSRSAHARIEALSFDRLRPGLQLPPDAIKGTLYSLPPNLLLASGLKGFDFHFADRVAAPEFNVDGALTEQACRGMFLPEDWGREANPERVLVWSTSEGVIYPTYIPKEVTEDQEAIRFYLVHVLLHEFFHTLAEPFRDKPESFFGEWRRDFLGAFLRSGDLRKWPTRYAASYAPGITNDGNDAGLPLEEVMAETFARTLLGISPLPQQDGQGGVYHSPHSDHEIQAVMHRLLTMDLLGASGPAPSFDGSMVAMHSFDGQGE